ncbi:ImmA/IrrE family metallo-endopeptidase [Corallococcus sicarius]|uniref:ImmA/IrrE family metallo-endopeptidase n=1 Tax=Corallococcus sicarius TaxID=2316726 RepID=A0A3A8NUJ1_9BACT|nr:ImmA/IrrE family metallo-endopeptidase [Corallococcus sicarius]RKH44825.1 ImmA/IrrE family metallo-endopeptidase [Corallococcus sicarius]
MKNLILTQKTAASIDRHVEKVLKGLGNPEPPLNLELVRELLRLDRAYYTSSDDSAVRETVSRIKVAGLQILKRPSLLFEAIKKFDLKALYLPDQRRILIDKSRPPKKQRWDEAHEIGHSLLPWHEEMTLGDNTQTLTPVCHDHLEAEANFAAGQLLFLKDRFALQANDYAPNLDSIRKLYPVFGNSITTTLWRYIELAHNQTPMIGVVSCHPHISRRPVDFDATQPCRYTIQSPEFAKRFSKTPELSIFNTIVSYCGSQSGGPLGKSQCLLYDDNGVSHIFLFETFFNRHDALSLGVYLKPNPSTFQSFGL